MLCFSSQLRPPSPLPTSQREVGPLLFPSFSSFLSFTHYPRLTLSSRSVYPATYHTSSCLSYKHFKFDIAKKEISIILSSPICFFPNLYHLTLFKTKNLEFIAYSSLSLCVPYHLPPPPHPNLSDSPSFKTYISHLSTSISVTQPWSKPPSSHAQISLRVSDFFSCPLTI